MEEKKINVVDQEPILPPGYHFNPTDIEIFKYYLLEKVIMGECQYKNIPDTDILAQQPWDLPGMNLKKNECYYFHERKSKSERAGPNGNYRVIKSTKYAFWESFSNEEVLEQRFLWGRKNTLRHCLGGVPTGWLMNEFALYPLIAKDSDRFVLCKIYKKNSKKKNQEHGGCQGSSSKKVAEIGPLHVSMNPSRSLAAPYTSGTHSGAVTQSTMNWQFQPPPASLSVVYYIDPVAAVAPCPVSHSATAALCTMPSELKCIAPVDLSHQTPTAFNLIEPYVQVTHPIAAALCTMAASSTIAPVDDPRKTWSLWEREKAVWELENQHHLSYDQANDLTVNDTAASWEGEEAVWEWENHHHLSYDQANNLNVNDTGALWEGGEAILEWENQQHLSYDQGNDLHVNNTGSMIAGRLEEVVFQANGLDVHELI